MTDTQTGRLPVDGFTKDPRDELDKAVLAINTVAELLENQRRQVRPDVIANLLTLIGDRLVEGVEDWGQERINNKQAHAEQPPETV